MVGLASENSDEDFALYLARNRVKSGIREVSANLLRVIRGAGKPNMLEDQVRELRTALDAYQEVNGGIGISAAELAGSLNWRDAVYENRPWVKEVEGYRKSEIEWASELMVRGALQIVASELLDQPTQTRRGESELLEGFMARKDALKSKRERRGRMAKTSESWDDIEL